MLAAQRRSQAEFSHYLNRCVNQCYLRRRGIEDPKEPDGVEGMRAATLAFLERVAQEREPNNSEARARPGVGGKKEYVGLPLDPLLPERCALVRGWWWWCR